MKNVVVALASLFFLAGCGSSGGADVSYNDTAPACDMKEWAKSDFPLVIHIPRDLEEFTDAIEAAGNTWNESLSESLDGRDAFSFTYDNTPNTQWETPTSSLQDNLFGFYRIFDWKYDVDVNVIAFTATQCQNQRILHADILFNDNFEFDDADLNSRSLDFETVLLHEMGHFLGLNHVDDTRSIMFPSVQRGAKKRNLSDIDQKNIETLYQ